MPSNRGQQGPAELFGFALPKGGWLWILVFLAMAALGGTNPDFPGARYFAQFLGCIVIGVIIASRSSQGFRPRGIDVLVLAGVALIALQMVPLPPFLWKLLPAHDGVARLDMALYGRELWRPLTLDYEKTLRVLTFCIPALAIYFAVRTASPERMAALRWGILAALLLALVWAAAQLMLGNTFLSFGTPRGSAPVAFFTNRNHLAIFVVASYLLWLAGTKSASDGRFEVDLERHILPALLLVVVGLIVLATASRTGFALLLLAIVAGLWVLFASMVGKVSKWVVGGAATAVVALVGALIALPYLGVGGVLGGLAGRTEISDDRRFEVWSQSMRMIGESFPAGTGFGTYRQFYEQNEPLDLLARLFVNHAHNDYLEWIIEGGLPLVLLLGVFLLWVALRVVPRILRPRRSARAGLVALGLLVILLHSLVDYPLRTIAVSMLAAYALGWLANHSHQAQERPTRLAKRVH